MIKEAILKLSKKVDLTAGEARSCMNEIMNGEASDVQMSSYLTALSLKGETIDEITGSAAGMREHCIKLLMIKMFWRLLVLVEMVQTHLIFLRHLLLLLQQVV